MLRYAGQICRRLLCVCAAALLLAACDRAPAPATTASVRDSAGITIVENAAPQWTRETAWRIDDTPSLVIQASDATPETGPLDPVSMFRTAAGEIVVADGGMFGWHRLLVFDGTGTFVRYISRPGSGPCEFQQLWWAAPYGTDSVAVFDFAHESVMVLGLDGGCGRSTRLPHGQLTTEQMRAGGFSAEAHGIFADGSMLVAPRGFADAAEPGATTWLRQHLLRIRALDPAVDTIGVFPRMQAEWNGRFARPLMYGRTSVVAPDGADVLFGDGDGFTFRRIGGDGRVTQLVRRTFSAEPVTDRHRQSMLQGMRGGAGRGEGTVRRTPARSDAERIASMPWADSVPPYMALLVDDMRHVWIAHYQIIDADTRQRWSVFAPDGTWLGELQAPPGLSIRRIHGDLVLGTLREESGVQSVHGHRLVRHGVR